MKAIFITTHTNDIHNLIDAWDLIEPEPAKRIQFNYEKPRVDDWILDIAGQTPTDVIFYIGGCDGIGYPLTDTFRKLRRLAPIINMVPDAGDPPWHGVLKKYRDEECFDLHVGLDGCPDSPVDLVTLTPVNYKFYNNRRIKRDIRCGMSGSIGGKRDEILDYLGNLCKYRVRTHRKYLGNITCYSQYAGFLLRCKIVLNTAWTGSGKYYHVKGRVMEAGWAGAALLECSGSPTKYWYPEDAYFKYSDFEDAKNIILNASDEEINRRASLLSSITREKYHPAIIYRQILDRIFN